MLLYMNCNEVTDAKLVVEYFISDQEPALSQIFRCFFEKYYDEFLGLSQKQYLSKKIFTRYREEELAYDAFNQGLLKFYLYIRKNGYEERGYMIKTFFFEFCIRTLRGSLKLGEKDAQRKYQGDPEMVFEGRQSADEYDLHSIVEQDRIDERQKELLSLALEKIDKRCGNLIQWRKLHKMNKEEAASRMGISARTVDNETYRCMLRLKAIIKELDSNS